MIQYRSRMNVQYNLFFFLGYSIFRPMLWIPLHFIILFASDYYLYFRMIYRHSYICVHEYSIICNITIIAPLDNLFNILTTMFYNMIWSNQPTNVKFLNNTTCTVGYSCHFYTSHFYCPGRHRRTLTQKSLKVVLPRPEEVTYLHHELIWNKIFHVNIELKNIKYHFIHKQYELLVKLFFFPSKKNF